MSIPLVLGAWHRRYSFWDRVLIPAADVIRPRDAADVMAQTAGRFGRVDTLPNTVGGWSGGKSVTETTLEDWEHMLSLNFCNAVPLFRSGCFDQRRSIGGSARAACEL